MCIVSWVVSGRDFEVDVFLARFPKLSVDKSWHQGDIGALKKTLQTSGFSLTLHEGKNPSGAVQAVRRTIDKLGPVRAALADLKVQSGLRFGLYVGAEDSFIPSLFFDVEDLHFFASTGLTVEIVGYPVSDDD